jgi:hypothetical protein
MLLNKSFYPTPKKLISKMWSKINHNDISNILEPSAGKGDILDYIKEQCSYRGNYHMSCIEKDYDLRSILIGKSYKIIDSDFLTYSGLDKFDLIIMNPPFDEGHKHLLKAIDILYSGQIVCLLNAETIKNPHSNMRKTLAQKLKELNATIEYIPDAFIDAERKTKVEVALIYIKVEKNIEDDLFEKCTDKAKETFVNIDDEEKAIASRNNVSFIVEEYNALLNKGMEIIVYFYTNKRLIGETLILDTPSSEKTYSHSSNPNINALMNDFISNIRKSYWIKVLDLDEVKKRMTKNEKDKFYKQIETQSSMDFTENNIREFILKLIGNYQDILNKAVSDLFDTFTRQYAYYDDCKTNIHYFNGWKTNKSFYCNNRVIIPYNQFRTYSHPFYTYSRALKISSEFEQALNDIDLVMNYFTYEKDFVSMKDAIEKEFINGNMRNIESSHFTISLYKKGTMHLKFKNDGTLRRFNIIACKYKKWLPEDYGQKEYSNMDKEEKEIVKSFEGKDSYNKNIGMIEYVKNENIKMLE